MKSVHQDSAQNCCNESWMSRLDTQRALQVNVVKRMEMPPTASGRATEGGCVLARGFRDDEREYRKHRGSSWMPMDRRRRSRHTIETYRR